MNQSKIYILPDGEEIDLSNIKSIGELKSVRSKDFSNLGYWYFTIVLKDGTLKEIQEGYLHSNWDEVENKLKKIRDDILKSFL